MVAPILHFNKSTRMGREAGCQMRGGLLDAHDIADHDLFVAAPNARIKLFRVANDPVDFGHRGKSRRIKLSGTARDDNLRLWPFSSRAPDCCAGIDNRSVGNRAAIDHDDILGPKQRPDRFAFSKVEPATQADYLWSGNGGRHERRSRAGGR